MHSFFNRASLLAFSAAFVLVFTVEFSIASESTPADSTTAIHLKDGRTIYGTIVSQNDEIIRIKNTSGVTEFPKSFVKSIERTMSVENEKPSVPVSEKQANQETTVMKPQEGGQVLDIGKRFPTAQGSLLFNVALVYSSIAPNDKGDPLNTFAFSLGAQTFVVRGVGVGLEIGTTSISSGSTTFASSVFVGPKILLAIGTPRSSVFPYLDLAYHHVTVEAAVSKTKTASQGVNAFRVGLGFLFRRFTNVGLPLELGAEFQSFDKVTVTTYNISIGISGFVTDLF